MSLVDQIKILTTTIAAEIKALKSKPVAIMVACSDETTAIGTGVKATFRMPYGMTLTAVRATLTTPSTSGPVAVDVKFDNASPFSAKPSIPAASKAANGTLIAASIAVAYDAEVVISCDTAGTGATGLKVAFIGRS